MNTLTIVVIIVAAYIISVIWARFEIIYRFKHDWEILDANLLDLFMTLAPLFNTVTAIVFCFKRISIKFNLNKFFRIGIKFNLNKFFRIDKRN